MRQRLGLTSLWLVAIWAVAVPAANAYIDPGTTSIIFQAAVAGLAAAGTAVTMFWSRIVSFFRRARGGSDKG